MLVVLSESELSVEGTLGLMLPELRAIRGLLEKQQAQLDVYANQVLSYVERVNTVVSQMPFDRPEASSQE